MAKTFKLEAELITSNTQVKPGERKSVLRYGDEIYVLRVSETIESETREDDEEIVYSKLPTEALVEYARV